MNITPKELTACKISQICRCAFNDFNGEEIIGTFYQKELQKTKQEECRIEKVIKEKGKWKGYDSSFNSWIDKKDLVQMSQYFLKPYEPFGADINVKVDLFNYATKTDLRNASHVVFALKTNLASLKTEVDNLDIDKLTPVLNDLAKSSNVVKNDVVKKTEFNKLVIKVDNIDTTKLVSRTKYENDGLDLGKKISDVDKKVPDVSDFVKKTDFNTKVIEIEGKIPNISGLATNSALNSKNSA